MFSFQISTDLSRLTIHYWIHEFLKERETYVPVVIYQYNDVVIFVIITWDRPDSVRTWVVTAQSDVWVALSSVLQAVQHIQVYV